MSPTKEPVGSSAGSLQAKQPTEREGTQPHPTAVKRIKVLLSSAHQSNTQLYPPPVPPIRKLAQASKIDSITGKQTAEARRTTILQPVERKPHSQKDRQNEKAKDYVPDKETR